MKWPLDAILWAWQRNQRIQNSEQKLAPGPKPDVLKIDGDWQDAVEKSFQNKKPAGGWPK